MSFIIALAAFLASLLTLFSGFGLGTLLTPVFGLFFPIEVAIALTGVVHLLNNVFKLALVGRHADRPLVWRFGLPSVLGGLIGAAALVGLARLPVLNTWNFMGQTREITLLKVVIGVVLIFFVLVEFLPILEKKKFGRRYLTAGGLLSGFFGGLSGNQGALRSAFLIQAGLPKEPYIATGVVIACMVDATRLPVYFSRFSAEGLWQEWPLLALATLSAFAGAFLGARFMHKVTLGAVRYLTAALIVVVAVLLVLGIL
jgi:uncharacterized membrane protein YfcA